jgi:hypothetical protein
MKDSRKQYRYICICEYINCRGVANYEEKWGTFILIKTPRTVKTMRGV